MTINVLEILEKDFNKEVIESTIPVVIDFWAPWCGPCRMIAPIIEQLALKFQNQIKFVKINVDDNNNIASTYDIQGIPTILIFKNGTQFGESLVGVRSSEEYEDTFKKLI